MKSATLRLTEAPDNIVERVRELGNVQVHLTNSPSTAARRNQVRDLFLVLLFEDLLFFLNSPAGLIIPE